VEHTLKFAPLRAAEPKKALRKGSRSLVENGTEFEPGNAVLTMQTDENLRAISVNLFDSLPALQAEDVVEVQVVIKTQ
jgi:hypothetical protein